MKYTEEVQEQDYDLASALDNNGVGFDDLTIVSILATIPGENDGPDWHWIVQLDDGRYAYISGGCDYTGWDCQSGAHAAVGADLKEVLACTPNYDDSNRAVTDILSAQLQKVAS